MGPEVQHKGIQSYAKHNGFNIVQRFTDVMTGSKDSRKELDLLLSLAKEGTVKHVIAYRSSGVWGCKKANTIHRSTEAHERPLDELHP
jgi:hypothetical protein